ncbi:hypothetical protein CCAL9344_04560 [Campylobacter sp. RM9344]|uniref:Uncharacterized protein n=1 Tax=Campylobacter californiensis TaxID=1032243 RepID=A0AAW3ZS72_9BACT|nr:MULTISPECIES: hypothetical protein [unclassified Campylobacter]MBE2984232.1 hypothetical protein [Campylobacter sp. RM6883]MBE2994901.1 hypothetical protein [Campylobacter sp. RM6913]MBE3029461.1 hypothetical protein [Campylobacter sp. RM9344]MBE3608032.1 hypothetical protein [Campylobacter sp. RM9337]QCD50835.1 putative membrane protein [Campylobacter sp. RM6914]
MKWLIGAVGSFIADFILYLSKKISLKTAKLVVLIPLYVMLVAFMVSFATYSILFIMRIWNLLREYFPKMFDYSNGVSGSFGGLPNQTIINSTMEFLNQSGLADAFSISMSLFISILSFYFALQLYRVIAYVVNTITSYLKDLSYIL